MPPTRMSVTIRPRLDGDLAECIEVLKGVYEKDGYPVGVNGKYLPFLQSDLIERSWVAEMNDNIVGHVAIGKATNDDVAVALWRSQYPETGNIAVMERLFVDPKARGNGVAAKLIETAVDWGKETSVRLVLFVLLKDKNATALYERLGWRQFGTTTFRYGDGEQMKALCFVSPSTP
ncbi:hypothetical protein HII31_10821 [Pseudocercospora fuligena]|uniref:N-acetyltransferase domain-containing protein n=1 Tax=Pseudocercospora fuligena TaxID=685502 RepID=A0A8H6R8I0_9PEZI|nr:hypothetical protein HII31_10821 [Pseudocercospora fuligena]